MLKVSIVVPFFNAERTLHQCIEGLLSQTLKPVDVILVDNNSTDRSSEIVRETVKSHPYRFHYLLERRRGPSYARNTGIRQAEGEIIAFTDSDCVPHSEWLAEILPGFNGDEIGAVAGRIVGANGQSLIEKFHAVFTLKGLREPETFSEFTLVKGGFPTANLAVRRDVFDFIHGFDEQMRLSAEDYDLCARIYKAGFKIRYVPKAIVCHKHRNTLLGTWRQSFGFGIGHAVLLRKHFDKMLIVDLPKYQYISQKWPIRAWIDLTGTDKKLIGLIAFSLIWRPLGFLVFGYLIYLLFYISSRLKKEMLETSLVEKGLLILLLIFKSTALSAGRLLGSIRNRVFCF